MGEVYRARDCRLGREVAIKVLPEGLAKDPAALARFESEARAVAALAHPNILDIHDFEAFNLFDRKPTRVANPRRVQLGAWLTFWGRDLANPSSL